jgi:predicted AlkP superfamily pyrophosphatase or phosphodiesterase
MSLVTGTWGNKHNVFDNKVHDPNYNYKNIFRLIKEQQSEKKIGIFSTWIDNRIKLIGEGLFNAGNIIFDYKFDGYELDQITYPHDLESLYIRHIDQRVIDEASTCIRTYAPDLSWVYLQYTDDMGHIYGDSEQFNQAITYLDRQMEQIWTSIEYRMKHHNEEWLMVITTDHGRDSIKGQDHGGQYQRERTTWIVINSQETNKYFRDFEPGIVDILSTMARFMNLNVPIESRRELDGIPLIGNVSLVKPNISLNDDTITIRWIVLDPTGNLTVWLSTTNLFKNGMIDDYKLIGTVPIDKQLVIFDIKQYPSKFYKIVLEGQYNMVNKWLFRQ